MAFLLNLFYAQLKQYKVKLNNISATTQFDITVKLILFNVTNT